MKFRRYCSLTGAADRHVCDTLILMTRTVYEYVRLFYLSPMSVRVNQPSHPHTGRSRNKCSYTVQYLSLFLVGIFDILSRRVEIKDDRLKSTTSSQQLCGRFSGRSFHRQSKRQISQLCLKGGLPHRKSRDQNQSS
jgi:hypothetical protein